MNNNNWWRWGKPKEAQDLQDYPKLITYLEKLWNTKLKNDFQIPSTFSIPSALFSNENFTSTFPKLELKQFSNLNKDRLKYAIARSYHDIIKVFKNSIHNYPDFILFPESEEDVAYILKVCNEQDIKLITYSGGSNVTGATDRDEKYNKVAVLNITRMKSLIAIDEESMTATFQAGIYGPELEKILNKKAYTLGHFPQSFEFSTLGGWIATRSAGQESGLYGKIEDMVLGLKVICPNGKIEHQDFPRHASGIDFHSLFIGSEGTLGVITSAKMKIAKLPTSYQWVVSVFKNFQSGTKAIKEMVQGGIHASIVRLSDSDETKMLSLMSNSKKTYIKALLEKMVKYNLKKNGYTKPCILMMRFAIKHESDKGQIATSKSICKKNGGKMMPANVSSTWEEKRFALPYLRDTMVEHRILIDTFETITYWKNLDNLYQGVRKALTEKSDYFDKNGLLFCHISHAYETGASLYFTLIAQQEKNQEIEQWQRNKNIVSNAITKLGGAISHHHGVGADHQQWYLQKLSPNAQSLLLAIKKELDPKNILNPGKLFDGTRK
ncbi:MAG: FAD-binding oxidoreductase [Flavobacteriaceae bacterium]|nr:FAD-binding oxidoreductase [Flavobacteriaceae bacterium]